MVSFNFVVAPLVAAAVAQTHSAPSHAPSHGPPIRVPCRLPAVQEALESPRPLLHINHSTSAQRPATASPAKSALDALTSHDLTVPWRLDRQCASAIDGAASKIYSWADEEILKAALSPSLSAALRQSLALVAQLHAGSERHSDWKSRQSKWGQSGQEQDVLHECGVHRAAWQRTDVVVHSLQELGLDWDGSQTLAQFPACFSGSRVGGNADSRNRSRPDTGVVHEPLSGAPRRRRKNTACAIEQTRARIAIRKLLQVAAAENQVYFETASQILQRAKQDAKDKGELLPQDSKTAFALRICDRIDRALVFMAKTELEAKAREDLGRPRRLPFLGTHLGLRGHADPAETQSLSERESHVTLLAGSALIYRDPETIYEVMLDMQRQDRDHVRRRRSRSRFRHWSCDAASRGYECMSPLQMLDFLFRTASDDATAFCTDLIRDDEILAHVGLRFGACWALVGMVVIWVSGLAVQLFAHPLREYHALA